MKHQGVVHNYDLFKGIGFIRRKVGKDVFFHYSSLKCEEKHIAEGILVSFKIEKTPKGLKALDVEKIG